jgi:HAD superfamily hydrolase (TIGR01490 family)
MAGKPAAFFDLDRTLMAGSSAMHFAQAAYRSGMVSRRQILKWGLRHLRFRIQGSTDHATDEVVERIKVLLRDVPEVQIARMAPDMLAGILPRIYPQMLDEVRMHQDAGRPTFIVSAAAHGLVELLARVLGIDGGMGTRYHVDANGNLTGELDGSLIYGDGKVEAVNRIAREHELDLDRSWAYSDSVSDLPMLTMVGNPVAVNPDQELAELASERGWRVVRVEQLGRRLAIGTGLIAAAAVGGGALVASRRRDGRSGSRRPFG